MNKLGSLTLLSFCLTTNHTTDSFEETIARVEASFYGMILKSNSRLPYSVNFCQEKFTFV